MAIDWKAIKQQRQQEALSAPKQNDINHRYVMAQRSKALPVQNPAVADPRQIAINKLLTIRSGAQRRDRDTSAYDIAILRLQGRNDEADQLVTSREKAAKYNAVRYDSTENLQKTIDKSLDLDNVQDVVRGLGYGPDTGEAARWFVKYRSGAIWHDEESERKYQTLLKTIEQNRVTAEKVKSQYNAEQTALTGSDGKSLNYQDLIATRAAEIRNEDIGVSQDEAKKRLSELNKGNYNALSSQAVSGDTLRQAGWDVSGDTINFSKAYSDDSDRAAVFSPVVFDATGSVQRVLSPDELDQYAKAVLAGGDDSLNLRISDIYQGLYAPSVAQENADRVRRLSERYYNNTDLAGLASEAMQGDLRYLSTESERNTVENAQKQLGEYGVNYDEYSAYQKRLRDQEKYQRMAQEYADWSAQNVGTGTAATLLNIASSPLKALEYAGNLFGNLIDNYKAGDNMLSAYRLPDTYDDVVTNLTSGSTEAITEGIRDSIRGDGNSDVLNALGDLAANTYGGVTSAVQSYLTILACKAILPPGVFEGVGLAVIGSEAANDTYHDVIDNGGTISQATVFSAIAGFNEILTEKISLDRILSIEGVVGKGSIKNIIKETLIQSFVEGSEEVASGFLDELADRIVNIDRSQYERTVRKYMESGLSEEDAKKQADADFLSQVGWAFYGGAIGGALGGFGKATYATAKAGVNAVKERAETGAYVKANASNISEAGGADFVMESAQAILDNPDATGKEKLQKAVNKAQSLNAEDKGYDNAIARVAAEVDKFQRRELTESPTQALNTAIREKITELAPQGTDISSIAEITRKRLLSEPLTSAERKVYSSVQDTVDQAVADLRSDTSREKIMQNAINLAQQNSMKIQETRVKSGVVKPDTAYNDTFSVTDTGEDMVNDRPVNVQKFTDISADDMTVQLDDGTEVKASDISWGDSNLPAVFGSVLRLQKTYGVSFTPEFVNTVYQAYQTEKRARSIQGKSFRGDVFSWGVEKAFDDGYIGQEYTGDILSADVAKTITDKAHQMREENSAKADAQLQQEENKKQGKRKGSVTAEDSIATNKDGSIDKSKLNPKQKVGVEVIERLADSLGIQFHLFRSKNVNGKWISQYSEKGKHSPNGFYKDGVIYVDINAGNNGEGLILFTVSHELVHYMRDGSKRSFNRLADFLMQNYGTHGRTIQDYIEIERRNGELSRDVAYEEAVARLCESFLADVHLSEKAEQLYRTNRSLCEKIVDFLRDIGQRIRDAFAGAKPQSELGRIGAEIAQKHEEVLDLFIEGIHNASENLAYAKTSAKNMARENYENANINSTIVKLTKSVLSGKYKQNDHAYLGNVSDMEIAQSIKDITGVNPYNYRIAVEARQIRHILKDHGPQGISDHSLSNINDIAKMGYVLNDPDYMSYGGKSTAYTQMVNGHNKTADTVVYEKVIDESDDKSYYVVEAVVDTKSKTVFVVTAFIGDSGFNRGKTKETPQLTGANNRPSVTSENGSAEVSDIIISDSPENIKIELSDANTKFSIREEDPPKKTVIGYKVFRVKNGKLYPPMVANPGGVDTPVGVWLNADIGERAPNSKTGRAQVKGKGGMSLSFRPGWHLGDVPRASQFDRMNPTTGVKDMFPSDFVWAECECAADVDYQDEAMSYGYTDKGKFRHAYAGLPRVPENGYYKYRTNPHPDTVPWIITGAMKVNRLLSDAEVAEILTENGVTPPQRQGGDKTLEELGLNNNHVMLQSRDADYLSAVERGDMATAQRMVDEDVKGAGLNTEQKDIRYDDSRNVDILDEDDLFGAEYDTDEIQDVFARHYLTHSEAIGEVLRNTADIEIAPNTFKNIVGRVLKENFGNVDTKTKKDLAVRIQLELEHAKNADPENIVNNMIAAVRKVVPDIKVEDERVTAQIAALKDYFSGRYYLTDDQLADLKANDETLGSFRRKMMGKVDVINKDTAKKSITGQVQNASELSLEGIHDFVDAEEIFNISRSQWDEFSYHVPVMLMQAFEDLESQREVPLSKMASEEEMDNIAVNLAAKITGATVQEKYNSRKNPYVGELVDRFEKRKREAIKKRNEYYAEKMKELRAKHNEKFAEQVKKAKEQRQNDNERRKRTELRQRIRKMYNEVATLANNPKKGKYIPQELLTQSMNVLSAINMDSGIKGDKADSFRAKLFLLKETFKNLAEENKEFTQINTDIANMLNEVYEMVGNTPLGKMTMWQLQLVHDTLNAVRTNIRNRCKEIVNTEVGVDEGEFFSVLGNKWTVEIDDAKTRGVFGSKYFTTQLSSRRMLNMISGGAKNNVGLHIYNGLNAGQLKRIELQVRFGRMFEELANDEKGAKSLKKPVDIGLVDENGNKIEISRGMMLSLYMHLQNNDNIRHVMGGGLTVPWLKGYYNGNNDKAFGYRKARARRQNYAYTRSLINQLKDIHAKLDDISLTQDEQNKIWDEIEKVNELYDQEIEKAIEEYIIPLRSRIQKMMTEYDKKWIKTAQYFFDVECKNELNKTTLALYGFKKAVVEHYFPIHSDKAFLDQKFEALERNLNLENIGSMKSRVHSSNAIYLEDISDVVTRQINDVSRYCGLVIPLYNAKMIYGFKSDETSVVDKLGKYDGKATKYIRHLFEDLQGARKTDNEWTDKILAYARHGIAGAALIHNLKVALKQAASYPTAAAEIGYIPLAKALFKMETEGGNRYIFGRAEKELIYKYTPLLEYRSLGYSTQEVGDLKNSKGIVDKIVNRSKYTVFSQSRINEMDGAKKHVATAINNIASLKWAFGWIQAVDTGTVGRLWYACKYYVDEQNKDLAKGSDEYYKQVAEVFNRVVENTQPNYTIMQRPDILRSTSPLTKMFTMFKTQVMQNFNILYDAAVTYDKMRKDYNNGVNSKNGVTLQDKKAAGATLARSISSQIIAAATIVGMGFLADAILHRMKPWRDDDEDITWLSVTRRLQYYFNSSLMGMLMGGSELHDLLCSLILKEPWYGFSANGFDTLDDLVNNLVKTAQTGDGKYITKSIMDLGQAAGAPLANIKKAIGAVALHIEDIRNGKFLSFESGVNRTYQQNIHRSWSAYNLGNRSKASAIMDSMKEQKIQEYRDKGKKVAEAEKEAYIYLRQRIRDQVRMDYLQARNRYYHGKIGEKGNDKDIKMITSITNFMSASKLYENPSVNQMLNTWWDDAVKAAEEAGVSMTDYLKDETWRVDKFLGQVWDEVKDISE